jgi:hypothetical protein
MAGIGLPSAVTAPGPTLPACTTGQLVPQLGATTVNQGVGSYATTGNLVRGKDTLVRFFLVNSAVNVTCAGSISIRSATLTATSGAATYSTNALQTFGTSGSPITSSTVAVDSNADPKFVLPGEVANPCLSPAECTDSAPFAIAFTVSLTYSTSLNSAPQTLTPALAGTSATFDRSSNALRVLVIPMGDRSQAYNTQFSDSARVAVQNGFAALSRMYPLAGGVSSTLSATTGGIRYKLDLAAMLDLKSVPGAYDANNKFCGTQANFDVGIKGQLAGFLSVYNSSITDPNQRADRVVGVVDKTISDGSNTSFNCAEAMASTVSPVSWARAIPDLPAAGRTPPVPSMTGPLMAMELAHTFGLDLTPSFHSSNTQADLTAPDKAYNLSSRSYLADDRSTMRFVSANPFNNNSALFEPLDFQQMLCNLGGSITANCTTAAVGATVAAGPTFAIFGTTDFTASGTHVLESYGDENGDDNDAIFDADGGDLVLQFFGPTDNPIGPDVTVPYSNKSSEHDDATNVQTTNAVFGGVFDAPPGYTKVKLVHIGATNTTLYERSTANLEPGSAGIGSFAPGGSVTVGKTLATPTIPPKPDVVFLADTTGSMGDALTDMKANVAGIMNQVLSAQPLAQFGVASYKDFGCTISGVEETPFTLEQALTTSTSAVQTGVNSWSTVPGSGCDKPEAQLWALYKLATDGGAGWRPGSSRIIVWFGDASGHNPSSGIGLAAAIAALNTTGIRVIAINLVNAGEGSSLDGDGPGATVNAGQATAIVTATGGVLETRSSLNQVSAAILDGLANLPATVKPQVTTCNPNLAVSFDAASKTVTSGESVSFTETIGISGAATPGSTLNCTVQFLVNDLLPDDPAFTQTLSIKLTGESGLIASFESANPALVRAHVVYDCGNGEKEPAFVALEGTAVAANIVQFQQNVDPSLSCANASGTASLTIVGTNGVDAVAETVLTSPGTLPVANKAPSAAINQPTMDAMIPYTSQFSLNGHVADPEEGDLTAQWTFVSGPTAVTIPGGGVGNVIDVPPPAGGWAPGDYTFRLSGTDAHAQTDTADVTVHVARYAFAGFFAPVDNPPVINTGKAGSTYPLKWSLTQGGTTVSDLAAVVALRFAAIGCGAQPPDVLETVAAGGSVLRYDVTYIYNWQTPKAPGCYVVTLTLADGSTWPAFFQLK